MSNVNKKEENRFLTIREFLEPFLDMIGIQCFKFVLDGQCYAATTKRNARLTVAIPKTIINENLKTIDDFIFIGVAIPRKLIDIKTEDIKDIEVQINKDSCKHIITLKNGKIIEL